MRGQVSAWPPNPVGAPYRTSAPVPALFHEDPLFLELCAAFDELFAPVVTALDCFAGYLDPWTAPADFLDWLGALVGIEPGEAVRPARSGEPGEPFAQQRAAIAGAMRAYQTRGTAEGLRAVAAFTAGVPVSQVIVAECGRVMWSDTPGTAPPAFDPVVRIKVTVPAGSRDAATAALAQAALDRALPVFSQLHIDVEES